MRKIKIFRVEEQRLGFLGSFAIFCTLVFGIISSCSDDDEVPDNQEPNALFSASITNANTGQEISFTDQSTDADGQIVSWVWQFGDGTTTTVQNPSKSFNSEGTFTVTLSVTDDDGDTNSFSLDITVIQGVISVTFSTTVSDNTISNSDFLLAETFDDTIYFAGMEIQFTDQSGVGDASTANFSWDFGDGTTSIEQNPTHTYTQSAASYDVTLTITDDTNASGTFTKTIHVPGVKWSVEGRDYSTLSPAIDNGGNVYVGTLSGGFVEKYNGTTGDVMWTSNIGGDGFRVLSGPALSNDESTIYVGSTASVFHAIDASSGQSLWSYNTDGPIDKAGPAVDTNGNIYVGDGSGKLYAFDPSGNLLWDFTGHPDGNINSNALFHDGTVISISNNVVYAVDAADGTQKWSYIWNGNEIGASRFEGGYAIDRAGILYGAYQDFGAGGLFALDIANGNKIWSVDLPADARANSPILSPDESTVYISTEDGVDQESTVFGAYSTSDGSLIWQDQVTEDPSAEFKVTGALGNSGTIYVPNFIDDYYYLLDSDTGATKARFQLVDPEVDFPTMVPGIGEDGTIYWGTWGQKFFALYFFGELESLPSTGWPVVGADNKNRNRLR